MKVFVAHSSKFPYEEKLYAPLRTSNLAHEHEFILPHARGAMWNTKEDVQSSDAVVAEVSLASTGAGIEMGWAHAAGVPIILVYEKGTTEPPFADYVASAVLEYGSSEDLLVKLTEALTAVKK